MLRDLEVRICRGRLCPEPARCRPVLNRPIAGIGMNETGSTGTAQRHDSGHAVCQATLSQMTSRVAVLHRS